MDNTLIGGIIGLAGAVVGSATAVIVGRSRENREDKRAREVSTREEMRAAILDFCDAVKVMEATELGRWSPEADPARAEELKQADYRARRRAEVAQFRLRCATPDKEARKAAEDAFERTRELRHHRGADAYPRQLDDISDAIDCLIDRGEILLHRDPHRDPVSDANKRPVVPRQQQLSYDI